VIIACGTAFAGPGKLQSGPYHGPIGPITAPEAPLAPDAILYSNLVADPCNAGFKYDINNGFLVIGPNNCFAPGSTQWLAEPFVSKGTQAVTKVILAITNLGTCTPTGNKYTVQIYDASLCDGLPDVPLGSAVQATVAAAPPALSTANFGTTGPLLAAGQKYWVVVTTGTSAAQMGTTAVWWEAVTSIEPFNSGTGWNTGYIGGPGGFHVQ
jgi:hypothetical protein